MAIPTRKEDLIRVKMITRPLQRLKGEGYYEWRDAHEKFYVDILDLEKEIEEVMPGRGIELLDRIQNFRTLYINRRTGEVHT